jgi:glycerol-3-phosphate dehydrogenase (NAD(P)+)
MTERIAVLGAGSWGATLANLLAEKGHSVNLWEFDSNAADRLRKTRRLSIIPDLNLHKNVLVSSDITEVLKGCPVILSATPSEFVRSTLKKAAASKVLHAGPVFISVTKGLESGSMKRMSEIAAEEIPGARIAVLSGPSHAEEVCLKLPTAVVAAAADIAVAEKVREIFSSNYFRIYTQHDLIGVELGGTLKNIYAIACGISDGLGFGDNTKAAIMTRGLNEMARIGYKLGGELKTFFGLTGMGDLIVTCLSRHSRNRALGEKIGKGKSVAQALSEMTMVAEGYKTAPPAFHLAERLNIDAPLIREAHLILYDGKNPKQSLIDLMAREMPGEWQNWK